MNRVIKFRAWGRTLGKDGYTMCLPFDFTEYVTYNESAQERLYPFVGEDAIFMQFTGLLDKNGKEIYEGDIIKGEKYYLSGDGYKRKGYPSIINVICVVEYRRGSFERPKYIKPIDEHKQADEDYNYRGIGYFLEPSHKGSFGWNNETKKFDIEGDGKTCVNIEVIGNIYENGDLL